MRLPSVLQPTAASARMIMKDQFKRLTTWLLCFILLFGCASAEEALPNREGQTQIAIVCTIDEEWDGWGNRSDFRSLLKPWLYTQLTPFLVQQNTVVTHYALGKEKDGEFVNNTSTKLVNKSLLELKDIDRVCDLVLGTSSVKDYEAAYSDVLGKVTANLQPEDRLDLWLIVDASSICPNESATANVQKQLLAQMDDPRINLRILCVKGQDAADELPGLKQAENIVLAASRNQQQRMAVYTYAPRGENDVLAPVRDFYGAQIQAVNTINWTECKDGRLEGTLTVQEPARYMVTLPGRMQSINIIPVMPPVVEDDAAEDTVSEENAEAAVENTASEENGEATAEPVLPDFAVFNTPYGSWAVCDLLLESGEYSISIEYKGIEEPFEGNVYVLKDKQPIQVFWNDQQLSDEQNEEAALVINRVDNVVRIVPPVDYHEGITWHAVLVLDGQPKQTFDCIKTPDGDLTFSPVIENLYAQTNLQVILYTDQPHTIYEFGPVVRTIVENQVPTAQQDAVNELLYYSYPTEAGVKEEPLIVDLAPLFVDPDGDPLVYLFKGDDGSLSNHFTGDLQLYSIYDKKVSYHPIYGTGSTAIIITAQDYVAVRAATAKGQKVNYELIKAAETTLNIQQLDVQALQDAITLERPADGTDEFDLYGAPHSPVEFSLTITDIESLDHLAHAYGYASWQDEAFAAEFELDATFKANEDAGGTGDDGTVIEINERDEESVDLVSAASVSDKGMEWKLQLPASASALIYLVDYQLAFHGMTLPAAAGEMKIRIDNTAPVMVSEGDNSVKCEIGGLPNRRKVQPLSIALKEQELERVALMNAPDGNGIDVACLFDDQETKNKLSYRIWVQGDGDSVQLLDKDHNPVAMHPEGYYLLDGAENNTVFDLQLLDVGLCDIRIEAFDGGLTSDQPWNLHLEVTSRFVRLLIIAGIIAAGILLLIIIILVIVHACKPSFRGAVVKVSAVGDLECSDSICLDAYGKKYVSMLTLALSMQLPPMDNISPASLADTEIRPSKQYGIVLALGRKAQSNLQILNATESTVAVTNTEVLLAARDDPHNKISIHKID